MNRRLLPLLLCVLSLLSSSQAQNVRTEELTIGPSALSNPPLEYSLLPDPVDVEPGNAALLYLTLEEIVLPDDLDEKFLDPPIAQMPLEMADALVSEHRAVLEQLKLAGRKERCDWGVPLRQMGYSSALPSLAKYRTYARLLAVRIRMSLAKKDYPGARDDLRTGFAMARNLHQSPLLIAALVGRAVHGLMANLVQEWISQPGSPNLYWPLAELESELPRFNKAIRFETSTIWIPGLENLRNKQLSKEEWRELFQETLDSFGGSGELSKPGDEGARFLLALSIYPQARDYLISRGYSEKEVDAMPVAKTILLSAVDSYRVQCDAIRKWFLLPYPISLPQLARIRQGQVTVRSAGAEENIPDFVQALSVVFMPSIRKIHELQGRFEQDHRLLLAIEALRAHIARTGRLPRDLSEIQQTPVLKNPLSQKPFQWRLEDAKAVLEAPKLPYAPDSAKRYILKLRKSNREEN